MFPLSAISQKLTVQALNIEDGKPIKNVLFELLEENAERY
jgi:hypothetical protein